MLKITYWKLNIYVFMAKHKIINNLKLKAKW
jgi:hypothetical protein